VALYRAWIDDNNIAPDQLMFRTRYGNRPTESNWNRALKRACREVVGRTIRVYDCRHAAGRSGSEPGSTSLRLPAGSATASKPSCRPTSA